MHNRDIARLEFRLEEIANQKNAFKELNLLQENVIQGLKERVRDLELALERHPMPLRETLMSPLTSEGKLAQLEEVVKGQTFQLACLQESNDNYNIQLTTLQTTLTELRCLLQDKNNALQSLDLQLRSFRLKQQMQANMIEDLNKRMSGSLSQKMSLVEEKANLNKSLQQERDSQRNKISEIAEGVIFLKHFTTTKENSNHTAQSAEVSRLLRMQQDELQARNQEILRLRTIFDGNSAPAEEASLKNTIKHLRGEIGRYNTMMKQFIERGATAESLIKKYKESTSRYETELKMIQSLKEENLSLKGKIEVLQLQLQGSQGELQCERLKKKEMKMILVQVITENQNYHELMFKNYQDNYKVYISKYKNDFLNRLEERSKKEKWTSVEELIDVNEKLRQRLKLI